MSFHSTYSARNVTVVYAGANLSEGRPEDVYITISENSPRASFRKGLDGNTSAALSSDHSVTLTLSFYPESTTAKVLSGIYYGLKELERTGTALLGAYPLVINDPSGAASLLVADEAVLMEKGDSSFGADSGTVDFTFYIEDARQAVLPAELEAIVNASLGNLAVTF